MLDFYTHYYTAIATSPAYAEFCRCAYGADLGQHGFADMAQVDALVAASGLGPCLHALDLGCGDGRMAEYISDVTGAQVTGLDYVPVAIEHARARTAGKRDRLAFVVGDIARLADAFPPATFDAIISVDTLYFVELDAALPLMLALLKPGGRLLALYSHAADPQTPIPVFPRETLPPDKTPVAVALQKLDLAYDVWDFTAGDRGHAQRMQQAIEDVRAALASEGNGFLYENRYGEASGVLAAHEAGCAARYLYRVVRP
jgi:SAM-dependent methyltransferase